MKRTKMMGKLRLDRETLAPLQSSELDGVAGGIAHTGCVSQCTQCPTGTGTITRTTIGDGGGTIRTGTVPGTLTGIPDKLTGGTGGLTDQLTGTRPR